MNELKVRSKMIAEKHSREILKSDEAHVTMNGDAVNTTKRIKL